MVLTFVLSGAELVVSMVVITTLVAIRFKLLPDAVMEWEDVWAGAAVTALLFIAGRYEIAFFVAYTAPASTSGAAGSLMLNLLWVYCSSLILFVGVALTNARRLASGKPIVPRPPAVRIKREIVEENACPSA